MTTVVHCDKCGKRVDRPAKIIVHFTHPKHMTAERQRELCLECWELAVDAIDATVPIDRAKVQP